MKKIFFCLLAIVVLALGAQAQSNPFIGKWKIASIKTPQGNMNLEHRDSLRAFFAEAMKGQQGKMDSAQLNQVVESLMSSVGNMVMEFKPDGVVNVLVGKSTEGKQGFYSVDTKAGTLTQSDKKDDKGKTEPYKVVGETIVINSDEGEITLKKVK